MIKIMMFLMEAFTEQSRIPEYIFATYAKWYSWFTCQVNRTRHAYELRRSDGGPKYEIWLWVMKSCVELHLRLLESYQVRRLLDIHINFRVMRNKCEHQRRHQDWFVTKIVSDKLNGLTTICSNAWVNGIFTTIDPTCYQYRDFLKSCIWRSVVIGTTRRCWKHMDASISWQEFSIWWMIKGFWT